ncbi:MAG: hypothetical protein IKS43_04410 [Clostridia bacterium]|nr:hypothetical protein [Clostridia bacterium]
MKFEGKWRINSCLRLDDERGFIYLSLDELAALDPDDDTAAQMKDYIFDIQPDGFILTTSPVPEGASAEDIEGAKANGMEFIEDDTRIVLGRTPWCEEENGTVRFDSGVRGETLGEPVDPWATLEETEDGLLQYLMYRLERV